MGASYQIKDQYQLYFLTFQVVGWADVFCRKAYRDIVLNSFKYCRENKDLEIFAYVIMSNHVHCILRSKTGRLSDTVRDVKRFTSNAILESLLSNPRESRKEWLKMIFEYYARFNKRAKDLQFWTHENHAVELSTNGMIDSRLNYIHQNPVRAGIVEKAEDYLYSSARNYSNLYYLLEIDFI